MHICSIASSHTIIIIHCVAVVLCHMLHDVKVVYMHGCTFNACVHVYVYHDDHAHDIINYALLYKVSYMYIII